MDFIDSIGSKFLSELFPSGLSEKVLLGRILLSTNDQLEIDLHTRQKTAKEVSKWGQWGVDYNTIVIKLVGQVLKK